MTQEKIAYYFDKITELTKKFANDIDVSLTDALIEVLEDLNHGEVHQDSGKPNQDLANELLQLSKEFQTDNLAQSDVRKLLQLVILKTNRDDNVQVNHQITPDGIGYLLSDFLLQTAHLNNEDTLLDFTVGTGNLLNTVSDVLKMNDITVKTVGIDNDETQLALASVSDEMIFHGKTSFYYEDVVQIKNGPKAKAVIADLPVGYYPLTPSKDYETRNTEGRSYIHHLLIEKSLDFLTEDGWAYLIVPATSLTGESAKHLLKFIASKAQMRAFLQLPDEFFQDKRAAKAILVIQKPSPLSKTEVLMGQYPTLKDVNQLKSFLQDIKSWVKLNVS